MLQSDQRIMTQLLACQSTNIAVLGEIQRMNSAFTSELKSLSDKVDRLAETVYQSPTPKIRNMTESTTTGRPWDERKDWLTCGIAKLLQIR